MKYILGLIAWIWTRPTPEDFPSLDEYWRDREADEEARRGVPFNERKLSERSEV